MSIRLRLMLLFTALTAVILAVFSINVYYSAAYIRKNAFTDRLWERCDVAVQLVSDYKHSEQHSLHELINRSTRRTVIPDEEIVVFDGDGEVYFITRHQDLNIDYAALKERLQQTENSELTLGLRRVVSATLEIENSHYQVIVSGFDRNGRRLLYELRLTILWSYLASIAVILVVGWFFSRRSFSPIEEIIETAGRISESDLHLRVPVPGGKSELVRLVTTINDSFDRLHRAFEMQKVFVANASHELRTPLTALRGELELALYKERSNEEYRQCLSSTYESSKRISNLVTHLLLFAKTQADSQNIHLAPLRIDEVLMDVIKQLNSRNPDRKIEVRFIGDQPNENLLMMPGNENLLSVAFSNIIENGLKFSDKTPVLVEIETEPHVVVRIKDEGIGISLTDLDHVFEPFYRSKRSSETDGFGLGLTLAQQIFRIHGAKIHLESKLMEGTDVSIKWQSL